MSTQGHADIISIDPSAALSCEGVRGFFSAKDLLLENNKFGAIIHDEEIFASEKVTCCGQILACVVADTLSIAQRAAKLVKVTYRSRDPLIITIDDAIEKNSFYQEHGRSIVKGDVDKAMEEAEHVVTGNFQMSGQEHFYLETNAVLVLPKGNIFLSTNIILLL